MKGNQSPELCFIISDSDLCEDTDHVSELSTVITNDLARLDGYEVLTQLSELSGRPLCGPWGRPLANEAEAPEMAPGLYVGQRGAQGQVGGRPSAALYLPTPHEKHSRWLLFAGWPRSYSAAYSSYKSLVFPSSLLILADVPSRSNCCPSLPRLGTMQTPVASLVSLGRHPIPPGGFPPQLLHALPQVSAGPFASEG